MTPSIDLYVSYRGPCGFFIAGRDEARVDENGRDLLVWRRERSGPRSREG
jgi:hypothetical protein